LLWRVASPFWSFMGFCDWLFGKVGRTHAIALQTLAARLFEYLCEKLGCERRVVAEVMWRDYRRGGRREMPPFLREHLPMDQGTARERKAMLRRQGRHLG
jgi:hypothetical protein